MLVIFTILGICCVVFTLSSLLVRREWWVRMFDLPRVQLIVLSMVAVGGLLFHAPLAEGHLMLLLALTAAIVFQAWQVWPYTPLSRVQAVRGTSRNKDQRISVFTANVLMTNRNVAGLLLMIEEKNPDVVLAMETDQWWENELSVLKTARPYVVEKPLTNLYGMHLYSRYPLHEVEVRYLVEDDVPSIHAWLELPSGARVRFYGLHPRPPAPGENDTSLERDAELLLVAKEIAERPVPTIVAGDLNDVAWSHTSRMFQRISGLLDPRRGRGFYHTFHARYPFLRYPLDHIFHSEELKLITLVRLGYFGSDHFPMYIDLEYSPGTDNGDPPPEPDPIEQQQADKVITEAKKDQD